MSPKLTFLWREFLAELDALLKQPIQLHCIGGFVIGYGFARGTNDLGYRTLYPFYCLKDLQTMAGPGSALARRHKVHVQDTDVESIPDGYEDRLIELFAGRCKNIRLFVPDPYDLVGQTLRI